MMPMTRKHEEIFSKVPGALANPIIVTFGIDLREKESLRDELKRPGSTLPAQVGAALVDLTKRPFDKVRFTAILQGVRTGLLDPPTIESICEGRMLAQFVNPTGVSGALTSSPTMFTVANYEELKATEQYKHAHVEALKGHVTILFYRNTSAVYTKGEPDVVFVEAVGPWHKVTWLETSMMQAVYQARLDDELQTHAKKVEWLAGALIRCAKGVAYTRALQAAAPAAIPIPALFTGRRTGSYLFMILQNLFFADHFVQAAPPGTPLYNGAIASKYPLEGKTLCLGTSSCDSWYDLTQMGLPCLNPAGTHAHESSMVASALYPELDARVPGISQVVGHYLYWKLVWERTKGAGPLPMLPDTWGTRVFLHVASNLTVEDGTTLLSKFNSARQDSGALSYFKKNLEEFGYLTEKHTLRMPGGGGLSPVPRGMMASEIDDSLTYRIAKELVYGSAGIGGFFGDSVKVWGDPGAASGSMEVKAVEVRYTAPNGQFALPEGIALPPYATTIEPGNIRVAYPVKIGDPENPKNSELAEGKLSLTRNLADTTAIREYVGGVRQEATEAPAGSWPHLKGLTRLSDYFTLKTGSEFAIMRNNTGNSYASGGRRRKTQKKQKKQSRRGRSHKKNRKSRGRR
jgi:nicotinic acid phosphoribosyltransferase